MLLLLLLLLLTHTLGPSETDRASQTGGLSTIIHLGRKVLRDYYKYYYFHILFKRPMFYSTLG